VASILSEKNELWLTNQKGGENERSLEEQITKPQKREETPRDKLIKALNKIRSQTD